MSRVTRKEWYRRVNAAWPADVPPLTAPEAVRAVRRLYRFGLRRTFRGEVRVTSGRRYTWMYHGVLFVNPEKGWKDLVHLISHYAAERLEPGAAHGGYHARMELRMIKAVIRRGWLSGALRDPERAPVVVDERAARQGRLAVRLVAWERRAKRAATALKKLRRQLQYYARTAQVAA